MQLLNHAGLEVFLLRVCMLSCFFFFLSTFDACGELKKVLDSPYISRGNVGSSNC